MSAPSIPSGVHFTPAERAFVALWSDAASLAEVAKRAGLTRNSASIYAWRLRSKGVELKRMPGGGRPLKERKDTEREPGEHPKRKRKER
jgi:transposase